MGKKNQVLTRIYCGILRKCQHAHVMKNKKMTKITLSPKHTQMNGANKGTNTNMTQ